MGKLPGPYPDTTTADHFATGFKIPVYGKVGTKNAGSIATTGITPL